jgi:hypothetical protein
MLITLAFPPNITSFTPDIPWAPRGQHPVLVPDSVGLVSVDTTKIPLIQLLAAGFSPSGYSYAPGL